MSENLALYDRFIAETAPDRLQKILARYELFRMIQDLPGDIVECGVFKGSGVFLWAKLLSLFKPKAPIRVVGFDFFEGNRDMTCVDPRDQECLDFHAENWTSREALTRTCADWGFTRLELIAGNVVETTERYAREAFGSRIALLYLDVDNYEGSLAILRNLYPLVVSGGVVAFDEYGLRNYGEANAVDEYFRGVPIKLRSFPWANTPTAYYVKPTP